MGGGGSNPTQSREPDPRDRPIVLGGPEGIVRARERRSHHPRRPTAGVG
jgi:hypothetical protein